MPDNLKKINLFETNQAFLNHIPEQDEVNCVNIDNDETFKGKINTFVNEGLANGQIVAPTAAITDDSQQIVNTNFVATKFQVVSALPASPTTGVFYFIY